MKAYSTIAGARRASNGNPIVRILTASEEEIWIPLPAHDAKVLIYTADSQHSIAHKYAGSVKVMEIVGAHAAHA